MHKALEVAVEPKKEVKTYTVLYEGPLKRAIEIAQFYGFKLIMPPEARGNFKRAYKEDDFFVPAEERIELLNRFTSGEFGNTGLPALVCYTKRNPVKKSTSLRLEVVGSSKSIADALVISTAIAILRDLSTKDLCVDLNNVGDKDGHQAYLRDLAAYYKKNIDSLDSKCRQMLKSDVLKLFACEAVKCRELRDEAPRPLSYLTDTARGQFKEVIEFLENLGVIYQISNVPVSNSEYASKTIFDLQIARKEEEIFEGKPATSLARGCRYDGLSKKIGLKKIVPAVGISIKFDGVPSKESYKKSMGEKIKARVYLIQFGWTAKLQALRVIEIFRSHKIPLIHGLLRDDLASQLAAAEKFEVPFIAIIGQKEVVENTVMIRNMKNRSQDSIALARLGDYMKEELKKT